MNEHFALLLIPVTTMSSREPERAKMAAEGRPFCEAEKLVQVLLKILTFTNEKLSEPQPKGDFLSNNHFYCINFQVNTFE